MPYGRKGKIMRSIRKAIKKRRTAHQAAVRQAKVAVKRTERSQAAVSKSAGRVTAKELLASGKWKWEGDGMDPNTVLEPSWNGTNWEYAPAKVQPKKTGRQTTVGALRRSGKYAGIDPRYADNQPCEVRPGGGVFIVKGAPLMGDGGKQAHDEQTAQELQQCRGRTKKGTPCERIGNCPVRSHKKNKV